MRTAALVLALAFPAGVGAVEGRSVPPIQQGQLINFSLLEALAAVDAQGLAGLFGFIPESQSAPAFADYLLHHRGALKAFIKKGERDVKELQAINEWDQIVCMYVLQIAGGGMLPPGIEKLPEKLEFRVSGLVLAPPISLQEMTARRGGSRR